MTTLPQTSASRLARPGALSGQSQPLPGYSAPSAAGMSGGDVWRVVRANSTLIVVTVVLSAIIGYGVNYFLAAKYPRYTATGYVSINLPVYYNPLTRSNEKGDDAFNLAVEQRTNTSLLKSDALISQVLQNPNSKLRTTKWFRQFNLDTSLAKQDLLGNFVAAPIENSKLIAVSMSAADPDDCKTIVEEIVVQHLEIQKSLATNKNFDKRTTLQNLQSRLKTRIAELQERQRERTLKLGASGVQASGRLNETETQLNRLVETELAYSTAASNAKIMLERITRTLTTGGTVPEAEEAISRDSGVATSRAQLDTLETQLLGYENFGPENQQKKSLIQRRQHVQDKLDQRSAEIRINATQTVLEEARGRLQIAQEQLDGTRKQIEKIKGDLGDLTIAMNEYLAAQDLVESDRSDLRSIDNQLQGLDPTASTQSGIDWSTRPVKPDRPSFPRLSVTLSLAIAVGLSLSLGLAFLREIMDTTVRSPRDIAKVGQLTLLGMIPHRDDDPQAEGASLPLVIFQAPTSIMAEQYRQVRSRLQHAASLDTTRSILVTSPSPGDGKSVVASNLAASLALNGRRILLVDANFRRPELHKIFGLSNDTGLSDAMNSIESLESLVQRTAVPNLDVLTSGHKPDNATEMLESQSMIDLIERALEEYDHVVFDSGPLLVVSETVALAPRVDGVITVVRASTNSRGLLTRMRDSLRQLKAEHLGVVLNGVRSQGGGYYGRNIKTYYEYQGT